MPEEDDFEKFDREGYEGTVVSGLAVSLDRERLAGLKDEVKSAREGVLATGRHRVVVLPFPFEGKVCQVVVKMFGSQPGWKDLLDRKRGSKASRSFCAARFLGKHGVDTPKPLGYLERWDGGRLVESYYLSIFVEGLVSFKSELSRMFREGEPCDRVVELLNTVGSAMKRMHDAGFYHRDLGNQNIELERGGEDEWAGVHFIDLNRGRIRDELTLKERTLDFARLRMPSGFLSILVRIYWKDKAPAEFRKAMRKARGRFDFWVKSRRWRHPIKSRRRERVARQKGHLRPEDVWVWDRLSGQAAITLDRPERKRCQSLRSHLRIGMSTLMAAPGVWKDYRWQLERAFQQKVHLGGRIGMALEPADLEISPQLPWLERLGAIPVLLRFGHHEGREQWEKTLGLLEELHAKGHGIMVAVMQDRRAVLEPESWREFLRFLIPRLSGKVTMVEVGRVLNRVKWGLHQLKDYAALLEPLGELQRQHPEMAFSGPSCIDFEFHYVLGALDALPPGIHFQALSHELYVDRRGAPENRQGRFGVLEKAALLRAIASKSPRCDDRVIVSEVNWPLEGTGVWSPAAAGYLKPGDKGSKVHVSEEAYGWFMIRYLALTLCSGFVDEVYWWRLVSHGFGLVDERAPGGWRARPAFRMLEVFLRELGQATFVEKLDLEEDLYVLRFERKEGGGVILLWSCGRAYEGPWPGEFQRVLNAQGQEIELSSVEGEPVYLIS